MNMQLQNLFVATPEIFTLIMISVVIITSLFFSHIYKTLPYILVQGTMVVVFALCIMGLGNDSVTTLGGMYIADDLALIFKAAIALTCFFVLIYGKKYVESNRLNFNDYHILLLFSVLGMFILASSASLLSIYLGLELTSMPLYVMIALRKDNHAIEASLKYFVMGTIASGFMLYGISLLFGAGGSIDIVNLSSSLAKAWDTSGLMIEIALVFILLGSAFKLALVPMHMWAPDVYDGAPNSVTTLLSSAPKLAALALFLRAIFPLFSDISPNLHSFLVFIAMVSIALGNLFAVVQTNFKRLLAYSGIAHMGYILLGFIAETPQGYAAAIFYGVTYSLTVAAAFGVITLLSRKGFEMKDIESLSGLNTRSPWLAFMVLIIMFSMAGVPPTVGFIAKLLVLKALVDVNLIWLAVWGLFFTVIGAYYYIRVIKQMYFGETQDNQPVITASRPQAVLALSVNSLLLLLLGIIPSTLFSYCLQAFSK